MTTDSPSQAKHEGPSEDTLENSRPAPVQPSEGGVRAWCTIVGG